MDAQINATGAVAQDDPARNRWPAQIKYIVGNEACERFSYYGMRGILTGYIAGEVAKGGLGMGGDRATEIMHYFVAANYFMPLLGGWLSDKLIGRYHTILWVSLFYCAGHGVLACSDMVPTVHSKLILLYVGLMLIAFGSGGIKPCVSAFVGDQFKPEQSHLLQKAYGAFYWSINLGSVFAFLVIPWVKKHHGYGWAFGVPGIAMGLATLIFWFGTPHYVRVAPSRLTKKAGFFKVFWSALTGGGSPGTSFWDRARSRFTEAEVDAARAVGPILSIFALVPIFWALFDQTSSSWILQGNKMTSFTIFGNEIGAEEMQSANPAMVLVLVPLLTLVFYPRMGRFATPLKRMSFGLFLTAFSYVIVALIQKQIEAGAQLSVAWQAVPYAVLTTAEVLVSTTGLEFAFTQAGPEMKSTIMSFWLLTVSFGNLFVALITSLLAHTGKAGGEAGGEAAAVSPSRFMMYAGLTFAVAICFSVVSAFYKYRDQKPAAA
jgi:POT family proton-dependent oligopeptide transporter